MQAEDWREHLRMDSNGLSTTQTQILKKYSCGLRFRHSICKTNYTALYDLSNLFKASCNCVKLRPHIISFDYKTTIIEVSVITTLHNGGNRVFVIALKEKFIRDMHDYSFNIVFSCYLDKFNIISMHTIYVS